MFLPLFCGTKIMTTTRVILLRWFSLWLAVVGLIGHSIAVAAPLALLWSAQTGSAINLAPVVTPDRILVIPEGGPLLALDTTTGEERWRFEPPSGVWGRGLSSDQRQVYVCLKGGELAALTAREGQLVWRIDLGINCQHPPYLFDGTLYLSTTLVGPELPGTTLTGAKFYSINPADGSVNWSLVTDNYILQSATGAGERVYVGGSYIDRSVEIEEGGPVRFYALDSDSGEVLWHYHSLDGFPKALYATADRLVYIGYQDFLTAIDTTRGTKAWRRDTGNWVPSLSGQGEIVYYGSANTQLHAWRVGDGRSKWHYNIPGGSFNYLLGRPEFSGERLYFMSQKGTLFALDRSNGEKIWSFPTGIDSRVGLSIGSNTLFMGDSSGQVHAYKIVE